VFRLGTEHVWPIHNPQPRSELGEAKRLTCTGGWHNVYLRGWLVHNFQNTSWKTSYNTYYGAYTWHAINSWETLLFWLPLFFENNNLSLFELTTLVFPVQNSQGKQTFLPLRRTTLHHHDLLKKRYVFTVQILLSGGHYRLLLISIRTMQLAILQLAYSIYAFLNCASYFIFIYVLVAFKDGL